MRRAATIWAVLLALGPIACAQSPEWQGTIEERDGVVYVENPEIGLWADDDPPRIRFELEQVFGVDREPADEILAMIGRHALAIDDRGNVYVYDGRDRRLVSFSPDGSLRWSAGREGQGPGEFSGAEGIAWNGAAKIYVTNESGSRIDHWSTKGDFLESSSMSHLDNLSGGSLVGALDQHTVVLQDFAGSPITGVRINVLDLRGEGSTVTDFTVDVSNVPRERTVAVMEVQIVQDSIVVGDYDSYDLRFYNREGRLERVISRQFDHMREPVWSGRSVQLYSWLKPPIPLPRGRMLAKASWRDPAALAQADPSEELSVESLRGSLDLFDADGRYLTSVRFEGAYAPEIGVPDAVGHDGRLYTIAQDPFPHVRRYRVVIDER